MLYEILDMVLAINSKTNADIKFELWKCTFDEDLELEDKQYLSIFGWKNGYKNASGIDFRSAIDSVCIDDIEGLQKVWDKLNNLLGEKLKEIK